MSMPVRTEYEARVTRHTASRDEERRRSAVLARLRLATFLSAIAALTWWLGFDGQVPAALLTLLLFAVFGALVAMHARVEARAEACEAMRTVNARALSRLARRWDDLPDAPPPAGIDVETHPYAIDLDIFGRASVFQWLGPASTSFGRQRLAAWLLTPAPTAEILARQQAIGELAPLVDWRERLAALGVVAGTGRPESIETFMVWAAGSAPPVRAYNALRMVVYGTLAALWVTLLLHLTGIMPNGIWAVPLVFGIALSFFTAGAVSHAFDRAGAGERTLRQHAEVLAHIDAQPFSTARLKAIKQRLTGAGGQSAPNAMRALNRILGFADLRRGAALLHFPIQAFTLWDFHWLFALERWRRSVGAQVEGWLEAAGELDALSCLAAVRHDNPNWSFPEITADRRYTALALGHPLLPADRRVSNDVEVGPAGTVLLITGSNMSGKSTLLRAIGVNAVLAEAGAPVCAASLRMPPCDIQTSIRIQDSLERGVSYFMAALARLKRVIDAAEQPGAATTTDNRVLFYLLDEILQGTNSAERGIAVQAVARHLLDAGAIGAMTTHDLNLALEEPLKSHARLVHFTEIVDPDGTMRFDYRLREGLATSRNALRLMNLIGIDVARP